MRSLLRSKFFWATAAVAALIIFVAGSTRGQLYSGEVNVLFLPKNDAAARDMEHILGNAEEIPRSLAFYGKLLQRYPDIEDVGSGLPDYARRDAWDTKLSTSQIGKSSMVKFVVTDKSQFQAEITASAVAADTIAVMNRYYNSSVGLDIRQIDGPIVHQQTKSQDSNWLLISVISGLLIGLILYLISESISESRWEKQLKQSIAPKWSARTFDQLKAKPQPRPQAKPESATPPVYTRDNLPKGFPESAKTPASAGVGTKKAAAPENLPVGSEFILNSLKRAKEQEKESPTEKEQSGQTPKTHEASEEEVKERLNKLLRGGL